MSYQRPVGPEEPEELSAAGPEEPESLSIFNAGNECNRKRTALTQVHQHLDELENSLCVCTIDWVNELKHLIW